MTIPCRIPAQSPSPAPLNMITFFDIPTKRENRPFSLNTWKTRFCLNYKGLPYNTHWVEYPDIHAVYTKHDHPPTDTYSDGQPYYSVPAILDDHDTSNGVGGSEQGIPSSPKIFPDPSEAGIQTQLDFMQELKKKALLEIFPMLFVKTLSLLNKPSRDHFAIARAKDLKDWYCDKETLDDVHISEEEQEKSWEVFRKVLNEMNESETHWNLKKGGWFLGETISFADFVLGGLFLCIREACGEDSKEWKRVCSWNDGRWLAFLSGLDDYQTIV
jgi:Glutathione S-transferase, N-terminal domain